MSPISTILQETLTRNVGALAQFRCKATSLESTLTKNRGEDSRLWLTSGPFYCPAANSLTIKYTATNPANNTPLSSETEIRCNRLNSASNGLSAAAA